MVDDIILIENKQIKISNKKDVTNLEEKRGNKKLEQIYNQLVTTEKEFINEVNLLFIFEKSKEIKENEEKKILFYNTILLSLILSYNLADLILIIILLNSFLNLFFQFIKNEIKIYCGKKDFKRKSNFNQNLHNQILKELIDLNKINILVIFGINLSNTTFKFIISIFITLLFLSFVNDINYDIYFSEVLNYKYNKFLLVFLKCTEKIKIVYTLFVISNVYNFNKKNLFKIKGNIRIELFKQENKTVYINLIIKSLFRFKNHINFNEKSIKIIAFNHYPKNNIHNNVIQCIINTTEDKLIEFSFYLSIYLSIYIFNYLNIDI